MHLLSQFNSSNRDYIRFVCIKLLPTMLMAEALTMLIDLSLDRLKFCLAFFLKPSDGRGPRDTYIEAPDQSKALGSHYSCTQSLSVSML